MPQPNTLNPSLGRAACAKIYHDTMKQGGGSFSTRGYNIDVPDGYALSLDDERGIEMPVADFTPTAIEVFAMNNLPYIMRYNDQHNTNDFKVIGTWINGGKAYLDVATIIRGEEVEIVMNLARQHNQKAIYDFAAGKDIFTEAYFSEQATV